jgi:hypothetical protein
MRIEGTKKEQRKRLKYSDLESEKSQVWELS